MNGNTKLKGKQLKDNAGTKIIESIQKIPTGIEGLDDITGGGLPKGRPTLVCGSSGCGKTLFAMEFIVRGAMEYNEPGVFVSFEESSEELAKNVSSLGFDIDALAAQKKIVLDYIHIEPSEIEETGEYDLEGLFIRLGYAIDSIGAKRVALDTIESLFSGMGNKGILRAELRRLFRWLKSKGVTAIITGESGEKTLTRDGLEEYVSDCVILLDHRIINQISTRRLRIIKYRGSVHGTNEYPFLIDEQGFSVLPITGVGLSYDVSTERISTGIPRLDSMLEGKGLYKGSSVLISGTAGTGKTSMSACFVDAACKRGEKSLYFGFEESPNQIIRNMRSIGIDLEPHVKNGLLKFHTIRPTLYGLEMHLVMMHKLVNNFKPSVVIMDPISNFMSIGTENEVKSTLTRFIDFLKTAQITSMFTDLVHGGKSTENIEATEIEISSLMDTWILLRDIELGGERNRGLYVLKSRGMSHSNQIREFLLTENGIDLVDVYLGPEGVLTGSARYAQESKEKAAEIIRTGEIEMKMRDLERKRKVMEAQITAIRADFETQTDELKKFTQADKLREMAFSENRGQMMKLRKGDIIEKGHKKGKKETL